MTMLIRTTITSSNPEYVALREHPRNAPLREIAEHLWARFSPYADPSFPELFAQHIHPRFWEMYLGVQLLEKGVNLVPKTSSHGPDVHARLADQDVWIEAVAPREGTGKDAVPFVEEKLSFEPIPEDKIILRFTNAISEKLSKRTKYVQDGAIRPEDPYVIAVNGMGIQMTIFDGPLPAIIKAVYPVSDYQVTFNKETLQTISEGYRTRPEILKASGAPVPTNTFLNMANSGLSGALYSGAALWHMPSEPGSEMIYVHNSVASSRLPSGWLCSAREYYWEGNQLFLAQTPPCA